MKRHPCQTFRHPIEVVFFGRSIGYVREQEQAEAVRALERVASGRQRLFSVPGLPVDLWESLRASCATRGYVLLPDGTLLPRGSDDDHSVAP